MSTTLYQAEICKTGTATPATPDEVLSAFPTAEAVDAEFGVWLVSLTPAQETQLQQDEYLFVEAQGIDFEVELP